MVTVHIRIQFTLDLDLGVKVYYLWVYHWVASIYKIPVLKFPCSPTL